MSVSKLKTYGLSCSEILTFFGSSDSMAGGKNEVGW